MALLTLAFAPAPGLNPLTSPYKKARRTVLQKVRGRFYAPTVCKHRVSGSLSLPSRGPFHLSLTVLCAIGHWVVFSLGGWSPLLHAGFLVSRATLDTAPSYFVSHTWLSHYIARLPIRFCYKVFRVLQSSTLKCSHLSLGSSAFARRYLRNRCFFLFLRLLRCFSSAGSLRMTMDLSCGTWSLSMWVSPFGYLRLNGYVLLTAAFRSLSRPSSAPSARASTLRSFCLTALCPCIALHGHGLFLGSLS